MTKSSCMLACMLKGAGSRGEKTLCRRGVWYGILWILKTGAQWADVPPAQSSWLYSSAICPCYLLAVRSLYRRDPMALERITDGLADLLSAI
jgi:hypothetical protein